MWRWHDKTLQGSPQGARLVRKTHDPFGSFLKSKSDTRLPQSRLNHERKWYKSFTRMMESRMNLESAAPETATTAPAESSPAAPVATPATAPAAAPVKPAAKKAVTKVASQSVKAAVKPAAKTAVKSTAKTAAKPAAKKAAKPATKAPGKSPAVAARKPAAKVASTKPVKAAAPAAAPKPVKVKAKLVRDSFTMPRADFALIDALKERALSFKRPTKKSELLRAGLHVLSALSSTQLKAALDALTPLKPGRPKQGE
jgi:hypothetical protein